MAISITAKDDAPTGPRVNVVALVVFAVPALAGGAGFWLTGNPVWPIAGVLVGLLLAQSPKIVSQWERVVLLRLGRYVGLRGPGSCSLTMRDIVT